MEFEKLLQVVGELPLFDTGLLLSVYVDAGDVRKQLSRWTAVGKLYQLRRGLYSLAPPYRKIQPHPFFIANQLIPGSYVSLQSALAYYGMIPEMVPVTTSVTTRRPGTYQTPLGFFAFHHIQADRLHSYRVMDLGNDQRAFVASPEKALLDLVNLQPGGDTTAYLRGLRLQALEQMDMYRLQQLADEAGKPKLLRAVQEIQSIAAEEAAGYD